MQPPENPYEGFPNPNDPLPPVTPYGAQPPYGSPPPYPTNLPPRGPEINLDVISQAWTVLQSSIGVYIGATVVAVLVIAFAEVFLIGAMRPGATGQPDINWGLYSVGIVISFFYAIVLAGILRMAINHLRTGHADFGQVFSVFNVFPSLVGAGILVVLGTYGGFCLCIVPGLLLNGLWILTWPLIVDKGMGPIDAMRTSFNILKPQMWMALLLVIVLSLVAQAGALACGIGVLVSLPLSIIALAITYRNFFPDGGTGFNFPTQGGPTAPIADPFR